MEPLLITFNNSKLQIISDLGCNPNILVLNGQRILDGNEDEQKLTDDYLCKGDFLAPFPNRVKNGTYTFEGKQYQLVANETARGHALHGLIIKKSFQMTSSEETEEYTKATLSTTIHKDEFQGYPFDLEIIITFILKEKELTIQMRGKNMGVTNAPYGVGWHPYLSAGKRIDECALHIRAENILEVDSPDSLIPTGKKLPNEFGSEKRMINDTTFDTCFTDLQAQSVLFENIELFMDDTMKFVQMYTPDERMSLAIEPMSCAPNAYNNGMGLISLTPGQEVTHTFGIRLQNT